MKGFVTIIGVTLADGTPVSTQKAIEYGWITAPVGRQPGGWGLERHEVPIGTNLIVDQGRQCNAYAMGYRSPITDYVIARFGVGTGLTAAKATDVALEAPITLSTGLTKPVDLVDFPGPFMVRIIGTLSTSEANGYVISEMGAFTAAGTLIARKVRSTTINKTSDFAPTIAWRIRF